MLLVTNSLKFRESTSDPFQKLSLSANFAVPVPISEGGTGADNAADARVNLGVDQSSKNNIGTRVSLASYTSTYYTCPSDGFLSCICASSPSSKAIAQIFGAVGETEFAQIGGWSNGTYGTWTTLVRKGMRVKVVTLENSGGVYFYPLV